MHVVYKCILEEAHIVFMVSWPAHLLDVSLLCFFQFSATAGQTVCHPMCERLEPPQANTCTDLMIVFCSGHVAAEEMYTYVCVIRVK